jgi:predicted  nucleic acid-binding Zn-ribbon protein
MLTRATVKQRCDEALSKIKNENLDLSAFESQFANSSSDIDAVCKTCGFKFKIKAATLISGKGNCPCQCKSQAGFSLAVRLNYIKFRLSRISDREFPNLDAELTSGTADRAIVKCVKCGAVYNAVVGEILRGNGRCICSKKVLSGDSLEVRRQHFAERVKDHPDFESLDFINAVKLYQCNDYPVPVYCKIHEAIFLARPTNLLSGNRCPKCAMESRKEKLTALSGANSPIIIPFAEAISRAKSIHGDSYGYDLMSEDSWTGVTAKYKIVCKKHGEFEQGFGLHLSGQGCPKCGYEKMSQDFSKGSAYYLQRFKEVHGDKFDYSLVAENLNLSANDKIEIICKACGSHFFPKVGNHVYGESGCPECEKENRLKRIDEMVKSNTKNHDYYIALAVEKNGDEYDYSRVKEAEYEGVNTKVPIICKKEDHGVFYQSWSDHISGNCGCPKCCRSKMERITAKKLTNLGIKFEEEKEFPGLVGVYGKPLRFDFYLPDHNTCIECDGIQHFQYQPGLQGSEEDFKRQQEHDGRKNRFCLEHNIKLIRLTSLNFIL